jgi:tRNA threonylcarbamoyladenosine biosynthesis protein TsaB
LKLKILGIETSAPIFSLCLKEDDRVLYEFSREREFEGHKDALLFTEAKRLIDATGAQNINAIAVSIGPGMFTSLRVGLSLAKGLSIAYGTPVAAVNTLDVIGMQVSHERSPVAAVINAYRGEVYAAFYESGKRTSDYLLTTAAALVRMIKMHTLVIGPGTDLFKVDGLDSTKLDISLDEQYLPNALKVVDIALPRIKSGGFDDIEFLEPYYIKKTDAERYYNKRNAV